MIIKDLGQYWHTVYRHWLFVSIDQLSLEYLEYAYRIFQGVIESLNIQ